MVKKYVNKDLKKTISKIELNKKKEVLTSFFLDENYTPMTKKQIANILQVPKENIFELEQVLEELENDAFCYMDDSKRYRLVKNSKIIKALYEYKNEKYGFAVLENGEDIYINIDDSLGAMSKDEVLVTIIKSKTNEQKAEGKVIKIVKRNTKNVIGRLIKNRNFGFVEVLNIKSSDIYIPKKYIEKYNDSDIVEVVIKKYATSKNKIEGEIKSKITDSSDKLANVKALYKAYSLDKLENFSKDVCEEILSFPENVLDEEKVGRVDRTNEIIFTIDSEDAKDLDDAVSVKKNKDGTYVLSVYIADVSHYVKEKTALDKEAIARGTSIYIPSSVIPMLPKKLSNGICSLNENEERLSLAVDMKINGKGEVIESDIFKAVIKVSKRMSYKKVNLALNGIFEEDYNKYINELKLCDELAKILYTKRKSEGAIDFDIPEIKVNLDNEGNVLNIGPYEISFANKIIEEFMLVTNITVAERFNLMEIPFIYRIHEKPDEEKLRELNEILGFYGKRIKNVKNVTSQDLSKIIDEIEDEKLKYIISNFTLRTLKIAKYSSICSGHFGLSQKYYCHFTSPIRRYPDLFIHRVISDCLENNYLLDEKRLLTYSKQAIKYSDISSDMEKNATKIERDFVSLYSCMYMEKYIGQVFDGSISSVTGFGIFVELENLIEGFVAFEKLRKQDFYEYDSKHRILVGVNTKDTYKIGDQVKVKLIRVDQRSRQIDFKII